MPSATAARTAVPPSTKKPRTSLRITAAVLVLVSALLVYPAADSHLRAASILLGISGSGDGWIARYGTNDVQIFNITFQSDGRTLPARLYVPVGVERAPSMIIIPGVHHLGIEEPRLKGFATAMASHGIQVLTPSVPDIAEYRFTPVSVGHVGDAIEELRTRCSCQPGVLGLSFAGGLGLLAAADPKHSSHVGFVASIGAHDDVRRVLRFFATNRIELPDGTSRPMKAHEYGPLVVAFAQTQEFFPERDVLQARVALRLLLWEDIPGSRQESAKLSPLGRERMDLLFAHNTDSLASRLLSGINTYGPELDAVSPHGRLSGLKAPVLLLHGAEDNVVPPSEMLWLKESVPTSCLRADLISPLISHVEIGGEPTVRDKALLVHWMALLLEEADAARPRKS